MINLETSVTRGTDFCPGKAVHYRMNPDNLPSLSDAVADDLVSRVSRLPDGTLVLRPVPA